MSGKIAREAVIGMLITVGAILVSSLLGMLAIGFTLHWLVPGLSFEVATVIGGMSLLIIAMFLHGAAVAASMPNAHPRDLDDDSEERIKREVLEMVEEMSFQPARPGEWNATITKPKRSGSSKSRKG